MKPSPQGPVATEEPSPQADSEPTKPTENPQPSFDADKLTATLRDEIRDGFSGIRIPEPKGPQVDLSPLETKLDAIAGLAPVLTTTLTWLGYGGIALGTGGIGLPLVFGLVSLFRRLRRKRRTDNAPRDSPAGTSVDLDALVARLRQETGGGASGGSESSNTGRVAPVPVDNPPPPQKVTTNTEFVPVEIDEYSAALAWAERQLVKRYPGSEATLEVLNSLIQQYLSANDKGASA